MTSIIGRQAECGPVNGSGGPSRGDKSAHGQGTGRYRAAMAGVVLLAGVSLLAAACSTTTSAISSGVTAPGVTSKKIVVGAIMSNIGSITADFPPVVKGVDAYFHMVNASGGVDGRKLDLAYVVNDNASPSNDIAAARTLVEQDHVFAVVGEATAFFSGAKYLGENGIPTFGYDIGPNSAWENQPSLFGSEGSYNDYPDGAAEYAYWFKQVKGRSLGVLAYGVSQSYDACDQSAAAMRADGIHVAYINNTINPVLYGSDIALAVERMKAAGVNAVLSCMDVGGNIDLSRDLHDSGLSGVKQLWLNGYDESYVQKYPTLMNGIYAMIQHVPFEATTLYPGVYPGMAAYLAAMKKYEPAYALDETAFDGWVSASLFVKGLKMVGRDLTRAKLVSAVNSLTAFTADSTIAPVDWKTSHGPPPAGSPVCDVFVKVVAGRFVPVFTAGHEVFTCTKPPSPKRTAPPAGTPGT